MTKSKMTRDCGCLLGDKNIAVKIEDVYERNGFVYLWDKLGNSYVNKEETKAHLKFPTYFVVAPTSTDPSGKWKNDIVCLPSEDVYCDKCAISLMQAARLFSIKNNPLTK